MNQIKEEKNKTKNQKVHKRKKKRKQIVKEGRLQLNLNNKVMLKIQ